MVGSSFRACKCQRLLSPGSGSPAQSLVSIATGCAQLSVAGESGQGPSLRGSGSSSSSGEESTPRTQVIHPTHSLEGGEEEEVAEVTPPSPPPCDQGGSTHPPSRGSVVVIRMALQDEFPLGWSAFQNSPQAPLSPLSSKMKMMSAEHLHKLESSSVGPRPRPPPFSVPGFA